MKFLNHIILFAILILTSSCNIQMKIESSKDNQELKGALNIIIQSIEEKTYKGWWIYGEGNHIFKDEKTLDEYDLEFVDENMEELQDLYLAICEMEYFPMECSMTGYFKQDILKNQKILVVNSFEILYIEGCEE